MMKLAVLKFTLCLRLEFFLIFGDFELRCSYKIVLIKKEDKFFIRNILFSSATVTLDRAMLAFSKWIYSYSEQFFDHSGCSSFTRTKSAFAKCWDFQSLGAVKILIFSHNHHDFRAQRPKKYESSRVNWIWKKGHYKPLILLAFFFSIRTNWVLSYISPYSTHVSYSPSDNKWPQK